MKSFTTILKKELKRIFSDRRILTTLFMPGVLIYVLYSIMGGAFGSAFGPKDSYTFNVVTKEVPVEFQSWTTNTEGFEFVVEDYTNEEEILEKIKNKSLDGYVIFEDDFINKVNEYKEKTIEERAVTQAPKVEIYYNSSNENSTAFYSYYSTLLTSYESAIANAFDINPYIDIQYDLATEEDIGKMVMQMILPMILLMFLATGSMGICPDSIAGEKERGTIATLLITPANRTSIALGKVCALAIASLASASVSTLGLILSLPKLFAGSMGSDVSISVSLGASTLIPLILVIISTSLLFTVIFAIISTISKSVKEASSMSSIPMLLVTMFGVVSIIGSGAASNIGLYFIPFYNSAQCINGLLGEGFNTINVLVTVLTNVVITVGLGVVMAKLFNSEKVMFNK